VSTPLDFGYDTATAQKAVRVAERRELPVPDAIYGAAGLWDAVMDAAHKRVPDRPTRDDIPDTAEDLADLIAERARLHREAESLRYVATDFKEPVSRHFNRLVRTQAAGWIAALQVDFLSLTTVLATQAAKLPADLDPRLLDWRDPAITGPWQAAEGAAIQLDQLVADRQILARAIGQDDLGRDAELWAIARLTKDPDREDVFAHKLRDHVGPALREVRDLKHAPVSRWLTLTRSEHLTLQLALSGEVRQRQQTMERWHAAVQVVMTSGLSRQQAEQAVDAALQG
jgi:hypothetical protein